MLLEHRFSFLWWLNPASAQRRANPCKLVILGLTREPLVELVYPHNVFSSLVVEEHGFLVTELIVQAMVHWLGDGLAEEYPEHLLFKIYFQRFFTPSTDRSTHRMTISRSLRNRWSLLWLHPSKENFKISFIVFNVKNYEGKFLNIDSTELKCFSTQNYKLR